MSTKIVEQPLDPNTAAFLQEAEASKFDFHQVSVKAAGDEPLKRAINNAVMRQYTGRQLRMLDLPGERSQLVGIRQVQQPELPAGVLPHDGVVDRGLELLIPRGFDADLVKIMFRARGFVQEIARVLVQRLANQVRAHRARL